MKSARVTASILLVLSLMAGTPHTSADGWLPEGQALSIDGPQTAQPGEIVEIQVCGNVGSGACAYAGTIAAKGIDVVGVTGGLSTTDSLLLLDEANATYTCKVTAQAGEEASFSLVTTNVSNGPEYLSVGVYPWNVVVGDESPTTRVVRPVQVVGPGWGSVTGDIVQVRVSIDSASGMEGYCADYATSGLELLSTSPAFVGAGPLLLGGVMPKSATFTFEVTARGGELMTFEMPRAVCSTGEADQPAEAPEWRQKVRLPHDPSEDIVPLPTLSPTRVPTGGGGTQADERPAAPAHDTPSREPAPDGRPDVTPAAPSPAAPSDAPANSMPPSAHPPTTLDEPADPSLPSDWHASVGPPFSVPELDGSILKTGTSIRFVTRRNETYLVGYTAGKGKGAPCVQTLREQFRLPDGVNLRVVALDSRTRTPDALLRTGDLALFEDEFERSRTAILSIAGDVQGTGILSLSQLTCLVKAYKGDQPLEGAYLVAGDSNSSGSIDLSDVAHEAALFKELWS